MDDARSALLAAYPFRIDRFQAEAIDAFERGDHVVVAAPTGSGKTLIAEYGIAATRRDGGRAFYTAPIKALSNQKYRDLVAAHGADAVGLLTGDNSINADAPVVVMTTEVLRNMIYGGRGRLDDVRLVVLDEVHFLQDAYRGPVWEEVIIHLPAHVRLICLSATVSNVRELAEWIETVRGPTTPVIEQRRPVELSNFYLVADRTADRLHLFPMFVDGRPNREAARIDESAVRFGPRRHDRHRNPGRRRLAAPSRVEVVDLLRRRDMLPAICFIFSRAQCDAAAVACLDAGVRLTSADERRRIHEILDERLGALEPEDLDVLGYASFVARLDAGIASHHAGMVPPMKEVVEACFVEGLVKVVFATETLAVGINMPARTVVIEQLTKFNGDHHERLSPGAYTQLTGRAGRRGIDARGSAVVLWSPWVRFDDVARLASSTAFDLRSVFRPTYNMSANLVRVYTSEEAHHLLNLSFAQYQADREVVRIEARLERKRAALAAARVDATSPYGDVGAYRRARAAEAEATRARRAAAVDAIDDALERLRPGMVISVRAGRHRGDAVVTAHTHRKGVVRLTLLMRDGDVVRLTGEQFDLAPRVLGRLTLPPNFSPNRRDDRAQLVRRLRTLRTNDDHVGTASPSSGGTPAPDQLPVARDPDLRQRIEADATAERLDRDVRDLEHRVGARNQSLARDFDRVLRLLDARGYVDLGGWRLTERGEVLARVFHECDLLVAEVLFDGVLDGVDAADLAALVSTLVYEHRSADPGPPPWFSSRDVRDRFARIAQLSADLERDEARLDAPSHRAPDATFAAVAYAWVAGEGFAEVVADEELTGGDFVRTVKQLIDLLRQIALLAPTATTRRTAAAAAEAAHRGVVADAAVASASTGSA